MGGGGANRRMHGGKEENSVERNTETHADCSRSANVYCCWATNIYCFELFTIMHCRKRFPFFFKLFSTLMYSASSPESHAACFG
jgi:hypothetical protein